MDPQNMVDHVVLCLAALTRHPGSSGTVVRNNIIWQTTGPAILDQGSGVSYCPSDKPGCNVTSDPRFVNAQGGDVHLQAGSVAIQAGTPMPGLQYSGPAPSSRARSALGDRHAQPRGMCGWSVSPRMSLWARGKGNRKERRAPSFRGPQALADITMRNAIMVAEKGSKMRGGVQP